MFFCCFLQSKYSVCFTWLISQASNISVQTHKIKAWKRAFAIFWGFWFHRRNIKAHRGKRAFAILFGFWFYKRNKKHKEKKIAIFLWFLISQKRKNRDEKEYLQFFFGFWFHRRRKTEMKKSICNSEWCSGELIPRMQLLT